MSSRGHLTNFTPADFAAFKGGGGGAAPAPAAASAPSTSGSDRADAEVEEIPAVDFDNVGVTGKGK